MTDLHSFGLRAGLGLNAHALGVGAGLGNLRGLQLGFALHGEAVLLLRFGLRHEGGVVGLGLLQFALFVRDGLLGGKLGLAGAALLHGGNDVGVGLGFHGALAAAGLGDLALDFLDVQRVEHQAQVVEFAGACLLDDDQSGLDLPLIIVSGTMGEDLAVEALQQGADDYLVKQNLRRLVPAVERSLGEAENRRRRRAAERTNRLIMDNSVDVICVTDALGRIVNVSAAVEETWGYEPSEMAGRRLAEFLHPDELTAASEASARLHSGTVLRNYETRLLRKDGSYARVLWSAAWSPGDGLCLSAGRDVTEQRQTVAALEASEERFRTAVENAPAGIIVQTTLLAPPRLR